MNELSMEDLTPEEQARADWLRERADDEIFNKLLLADDPRAVAEAELVRLNAIQNALKSRMIGITNEIEMAVRLRQRLEWKLAELGKSKKA